MINISFIAIIDDLPTAGPGTGCAGAFGGLPSTITEP
jgi:hypothetical protein